MNLTRHYTHIYVSVLTVAILLVSFCPHFALAVTGPTFIQEAETAYTTTSPKNTASFDVLAGDVLVAIAFGSDQGLNLSISGGSLTWTAEETQDSNNTSLGLIRIWSAVVDSDKSMTVTISNSGSSGTFGTNVFTFRGSDGIGNTASTNNGTGSGAPTLNITTASSSSAVVVANADWNAVSGTSRTWRTNAGTLTEQTYDRNASWHTFYGGYHADAGTAGTYAVGLSAPTGQRYVIGAVEVLGTTEPAANPPSAPQTLTSSSSAGSVNLDWSAPADAGTSNMLTYEIYRHTSTFTATPTATFVASIATTSTTYSDTGATHGTNYYYGITATNSEGEGALSNLVFTGPNSGRVIRLGGYFSS